MEVKMDKTTIIVSAIVGSLGLLSAILGFSAEGTKLTLLDLLWGDGVCYYPQNPALALGVCAAIFLIIAQVTFAVVGGCCGCCKSRALPSGTNRIIGVVCAVVSWIAAVIAFALFIDGAALNGSGERDASTLGLCYVLKDGIFAGAAVLTLAATALGLTSYVLLRKQPDAAAAAGPPKAGAEQVPAGAAVIAMGHPQFPQQPPPPQGYAQAPPPSYPQYSPPPQGQGYGQFAPPPAQGHGSHAPNQQFPPPTPPQRYGAHAPNQQSPPPAHGFAPNQQYRPPAHGYAPNQQYHQSPPPTHGHGYAPAHASNQQAPPPQGYEQVEEAPAPDVAAEVAQGEPDGGAWTSEPVGDAGAEPVDDAELGSSKVGHAALGWVTDMWAQKTSGNDSDS